MKQCHCVQKRHADHVVLFLANRFNLTVSSEPFQIKQQLTRTKAAIVDTGQATASVFPCTIINPLHRHRIEEDIMMAL